MMLALQIFGAVCAVFLCALPALQNHVDILTGGSESKPMGEKPDQSPIE